MNFKIKQVMGMIREIKPTCDENENETSHQNHTGKKRTTTSATQKDSNKDNDENRFDRLKEPCFIENLSRKLEISNEDKPVNKLDRVKMPILFQRALEMRKNATLEKTPALVKDLSQYRYLQISKC